MRRIVSIILYAIVGLVFVATGGIKAWDPKSFVSSVLTYQLFPYGLAAGIALFVPFLEIVSGLCLSFGFMRSGAKWVIGLMLAVFIGLIAQAKFRGLSIDCGCFGSSKVSDPLEYLWAIGRDFLLLAALWLASKWERKRGGLR